MKKELGEAPLPIGGWLMLVAVSLLAVLNAATGIAVNAFALIQYAFIPSADFDFSSQWLSYVTQFVFCAAALPLAIFCTISLFKRKKIFSCLFIPLQAVFLVYTWFSTLVVGRYWINEIGFIQNPSFKVWFKIIFWTVLGIALIVYLYRSERARKTFVFSSNEIIAKDESSPPQISVWLVFVAMFIVSCLISSFFGFVCTFSNIGDAGVVAVIEYLLRLFVSIWALVLFFRQKKFFKWLVAAFAVFFMVQNTFFLASAIQQSNDFSYPWYYFIYDYLQYAYYIALIIYVFASRRVRDTFVDPLGIHFKRVFPAVKKSLRYGLPDEARFTDALKEKLDTALAGCKAQPVGGGYVDVITAPQFILPFIQAMQSLGIRIRAVSWWCFDQGGEGCPHGLESKKSLYFQGSFSEMLIPVRYFKKDESYEEIQKYILEDFPHSPEYLPCLVPGFWLDVPEGG